MLSNAVAEERFAAVIAQVIVDTRPLTDPVCDRNGAIAFARRQPGLAEVCILRREAEVPEVWGQPLPLLSLLAFDGEAVYAATQSELLRVTSSGVTVIHRVKGQITSGKLSPDGRNLSWVVREDGWHAFHSATGGGRIWEVAPGLDTLDVTWLSPAELVVRWVDADETRNHVMVWRLSGESDPFLETTRTVDAIASDPVRGLVFISAGGSANAHGKDTEVRDDGGLWRCERETHFTPICVGRRRAGSRVSVAPDGRCAFGGLNASPIGSDVVIAGGRGCSVTQLRCLVQDVAFDGDRVLFRQYGATGAILAVQAPRT